MHFKSLPPFLLPSINTAKRKKSTLASHYIITTSHQSERELINILFTVYQNQLNHPITLRKRNKHSAYPLVLLNTQFPSTRFIPTHPRHHRKPGSARFNSHGSLHTNAISLPPFRDTRPVLLSHATFLRSRPTFHLVRIYPTACTISRIISHDRVPRTRPCGQKPGHDSRNTPSKGQPRICITGVRRKRVEKNGSPALLLVVVPRRRLLLRGLLSRGVNTSCETTTLPLLPCAAWFVGRLLG